MTTPPSPLIDRQDRKKVSTLVTIYKPADSQRWYAQYQQDGVQRRYSLKTDSKKQAVKLAEAITSKLVQGEDPVPVRRTAGLTDAVEQYIVAKRLEGRVPKTLWLYERILREFAAYAAEQHVSRLDQLSAGLIESYQAVLERSGYAWRDNPKRRRRPLRPLSPKSVRDKVKVIRGLVQWARRRALVRSDPTAGYRLPPKPKGKPFCFTPEQLQAIYRHAAPHDRKLFQFVAMTGLRAEELRHLTKDDVTQTLLRIRAKPGWRPKHGRERNVPLCPEARAIADEMIKASTCQWVFTPPGSPSTPYAPGRVARALNRARVAAGLARGSLHTLRHTFCSQLANQNVPAFQLKEIMGHESLDTVLAYYTLHETELVRSIAAVDFSPLGAGGDAEAT